MAITKRERARKEREKVEYEWGTLWPQWHNEKMNWGKGFRTKGDVDILFLAGLDGKGPLAGRAMPDTGGRKSRERENRGGD